MICDENLSCMWDNFCDDMEICMIWLYSGYNFIVYCFKVCIDFMDCIDFMVCIDFKVCIDVKVYVCIDMVVCNIGYLFGVLYY